MATLAQLAEAEARASLPRPARGWTLVLLGRAADRLGDAGRAADCFRLVTELGAAGTDPGAAGIDPGAAGIDPGAAGIDPGAAGIDPGHPVILTAPYHQAGPP